MQRNNPTGCVTKFCAIGGARYIMAEKYPRQFILTKTNVKDINNLLLRIY